MLDAPCSMLYALCSMLGVVAAPLQTAPLACCRRTDPQQSRGGRHAGQRQDSGIVEVLVR